ncbi:oligopeptide ABC transporter substrate-binding protein [Bacillus sporothermodurans]|uniref:oligopeptide ABC transporter substrate-binding protein n=1 Tax=Heyndrickxia sporothermodurans TaxID=46224 RepID=UPI00192C9E61|nr:oligopeptide ABC transporter substrate-binding protein [Heyndrickxia sporothermodurans]MBL5766791.1 oligopeptide ABC transporter substrate-binding protein [Heyndrickxia sporothermodurans]MBL5771524.1 oligopeptide ABC transporter substrate-binding protein [Heyndrickxia sporothermodurans]MBL5774102.1 oligopeptide ABC transporter substrate-binding protein [Heyndrickxia sporothermodurans]MBL5777519.1 oligopeptide ABC transporter substrate-binding protein [Heyndrickxia sporothermodurans]MBL57846
MLDINSNFSGSQHFFDDDLIKYDDQLKAQPNIASWETKDNKVYKFTFKKGVKWHNGEELTVDDWIFAIETLANKDYEGPRYENVKNIEGAPAYRNKKAKTITGLKKIDDYNIEITFDKARVNNLENLWTHPMSRKEFEGIAVKDMMSSPQVRQKPIGTGPFKVNKIVPGESIEFVRNEDYWQGKPHIEKIILKVIDPSLVVGELKNEKLDLTKFHMSIYDEVKKLNNVEVLKAPGLSYFYVGFRLGTWDGDKNKNVMNFDKYQNKKLRQAMAYAINREEWTKAFFFGLGKPVNRPVPSAHWIAADNSELPNQYEYDPEKAKKLLDEAGYKDTNGDGFREDPNGKEFVVNFSHYATDNPTFESRAKALTQYWEAVGLKTKLKMIDSNLYYDMLDKADKSLEVFYGGWSTGTDPDPSGLWTSDALWNYPRWVNEQNDKLLADALDVKIVGTDQEKRKQLYVEWQKLVNEELPMIPIGETDEVYAVSKRLKGVKLDVSGTNRPHEWWIEQ